MLSGVYGAGDRRWNRLRMILQKTLLGGLVALVVVWLVVAMVWLGTTL